MAMGFPWLKLAIDLRLPSPTSTKSPHWFSWWAWGNLCAAFSELMFRGGVVGLVWMLCFAAGADDCLNERASWFRGKEWMVSCHGFNFITKGTLAAPRKCSLGNCFHCLRKSPSDAPMGSWHFQFIKASVCECMYSARNLSGSKKGLKKAWTLKASIVWRHRLLELSSLLL